jgi:hypothetical protein
MVLLLNEYRKDGSALYMSAQLRADGGLDIMGHDRGPITEHISPSGDYEWHYVVAATDLPAAVAVLGGEPGADVLELRQRRWSGPASYKLESTLRESGIKYKFWS